MIEKTIHKQTHLKSTQSSILNTSILTHKCCQLIDVNLIVTSQMLPTLNLTMVWKCNNITISTIEINNNKLLLLKLSWVLYTAQQLKGDFNVTASKDDVSLNMGEFLRKRWLRKIYWRHNIWLDSSNTISNNFPQQALFSTCQNTYKNNIECGLVQNNSQLTIR